jgi:hypothetical protein
VTRGSARNAGLAADRAEQQGPGYKARERALRRRLEEDGPNTALQSHQRRLSTPGYRFIDESEGEGSESESEGAGLRRSERISERD